MKYVSIDTETTGIDHTKNQILSIGAVIEDTNNQIKVDQLPKLEMVVDLDHVIGHPTALSMNSELLKTISKYQSLTIREKFHYEKEIGKKILKPHEVAPYFFYWLLKNGFESNIILDDLQHEVHPFAIVFPNYSTNSIELIEENKELIKSTIKKIDVIAAGKNFSKFDRNFLEQLPLFNQLISIKARAIDPGTMFIDWESDEYPPGLLECKKRAGIKNPEVTHNAVDDAIDVIKCIRYKINK
jgi:DNA polymerase III epsilon subunit-like protein